jgi:glycosyltransferase involved in cell wall biosynthesis
MTGDLVSIVVNTYYRNETLGKAIESARGQTYDNTEVVVVDGSGEGHAAEVVDGFADVRYVGGSGNDDGVLADRVIGLDATSGAYVQFLDDDDQLCPEKIERQLPLFGPETGVVYAGRRFLEDGVEELPNPSARGAVLNRALAWQMDPAVTGTMLFRRSDLEAARPFTFHGAADDLGIMIELARRTNFDYVDEPLLVMSTGDEPTLSERIEHVRALLDLRREFADLYEAAPAWVWRSTEQNIQRKYGWWYARNRLWSPRAAYHFLQAARYDQQQPAKWLVLAALSLFGRPAVELALGIDRLLKQDRRRATTVGGGQRDSRESPQS